MLQNVFRRVCQNLQIVFTLNKYSIMESLTRAQLLNHVVEYHEDKSKDQIS